MAQTIKEEGLRLVLPIVRKQVSLVDAAKLCPYGKRSLERWVAAYKRSGEASHSYDKPNFPTHTERIAAANIILKCDRASSLPKSKSK